MVTINIISDNRKLIGSFDVTNAQFAAIEREAKTRHKSVPEIINERCKAAFEREAQTGAMDRGNGWGDERKSSIRS